MGLHEYPPIYDRPDRNPVIEVAIQKIEASVAAWAESRRRRFVTNKKTEARAWDRSRRAWRGIDGRFGYEIGYPIEDNGVALMTLQSLRLSNVSVNHPNAFMSAGARLAERYCRRFGCLPVDMMKGGAA